eukprot:125047-Pleurochrysis_carterae.AAC.1
MADGAISMVSAKNLSHHDSPTSNPHRAPPFSPFPATCPCPALSLPLAPIRLGPIRQERRAAASALFATTQAHNYVDIASISVIARQTGGQAPRAAEALRLAHPAHVWIPDLASHMSDLASSTCLTWLPPHV